MFNNEIAIYQSDFKRKQSVIGMFTKITRDLYQFRFMIFQLFLRDFTVNYKKSFVGIAWLILSPLVSVIAWVFLQKTGMLNPGEVDVPYPVYVLVGTLCWDFLVGVHTYTARTLISGRTLALQIKYPHEALFVKELMLFCANYFIRFLIVMLAIWGLGHPPSWQVILFPIVALPVIFFMGGIGLIASLLEVVTSDISKIVGVAYKLLIWTVPVIYTTSVDHWLVKKIIMYNPLTYLVCNLRDIILYGRFYEGEVFLYLSGASVIFFIIAVRIFYITEEKLVEKML